MVATSSIERNPLNPRLYFNEERLEWLRASIQEVGILVPLIVFEREAKAGAYVLLDGERRLRCAEELSLVEVPVNIIPTPSELDNILRMFNIHAVREDWPLVSVAVSLKKVMSTTGEERETRLSEMTGLPRTTIRRAKRLLAIPAGEFALIQAEAEWSRKDQVHREDLYLEIDAAESLVRNSVPEVAREFSREAIFRSFAAKYETKKVEAVTEFRVLSKVVEASRTDIIPRDVVVDAIARLVEDPSITPRTIYEDLFQGAYLQATVEKRASSMLEELYPLVGTAKLTSQLRQTLSEMATVIQSILR